MRKLRQAHKVLSLGLLFKLVFLFPLLALVAGIPSPALVEKREDLRGRQEVLHKIWGEAGVDLDMSAVKSLEGDTASKLDKIKALDTELGSLFDEIKGLEEIGDLAEKNAEREKYLNTPANRMQHPGGGPLVETKDGNKPFNMGKLFMQTKAFEAAKDGSRNTPVSTIDVDLKAIFETGAGWDPEAIRLPRVELDPQRPIAVIDSVPMLATGLDTIRYMEETTFTNPAAETAEATATAAVDLIPEATLILTEQTRPVEWLPVFIPVTQQQMEDVAGVEDYVNSRLMYMLRARLDLQILRGNGVTPNLLGTNSVVGINVQPKGVDPTPDAIYKGMTLVRTVGFAEPSVVFVHPNDWQDIRLLRTADGLYIFGSPLDAGAERIWGVPVVQSTAVLENTITLGDYRNFAAVFTKRGITMSVSDSHASFFTRGTLAIRADMRIAVVHYRPEAFTTVTGV